MAEGLLDKGDSIMAEGLLARTRGSVSHNCRITVYPDGSIGEIMACSMARWIPPGWEIRPEKPVGPRAFVGTNQPDAGDRARRRSKKRVSELIHCNSDLDIFFTLTLRPGATTENGIIVGRTDYGAINRKLQQWLADRVRRRGLKYVAVYELHDRVESDGKRALHVHGVANHSALRLDESGRKYKDKWGHWHKIYNVSDWPLGHTTAMYLYGKRNAAIAYIAKYIYKSEEPIGGRWYMHSHNLQEPHFIYVDVDFSAMPGYIVCVPQAGLSYKYIPVDHISDIVKAGAL